MSIPRIKFTGDRFAQIMNSVFAENLRDLVDKVELGGGEYPKGFFHTSAVSHPGPCYYDQMWARDCGRGVIELSRLGFAKEAALICDYFLSHITYGDHWSREIHNPDPINADELDGNALILSAFYNAWTMNGRPTDLGCRWLTGLQPVLEWCEKEITGSKYNNLLPSRSELSGNPETPYTVYGLFGNYAMLTALKGIEKMQLRLGKARKKTMFLIAKLEKGLTSSLISDGKRSKAEAGCFMNGVDSRDHSAYDIMEFAGNHCDAWHWTRQTPYILNSDSDTPLNAVLPDANAKSYIFVKKFMVDGELFRKYGFVSNTGWSGIGNRHDDTMCGYGQGFFTQAALLADDVNCYGKCLEGIARLAYDGNIIEHATHELNPFLLHECFTYENYEKALDHTFGRLANGDPCAMDNPGEEGNLVQFAEVIKALRYVAGVDYGDEGVLRITPRLPWLWDKIEVTDYPVLDKTGRPAAVSFVYRNDRHLRSSTIEITNGFEKFNKVIVRFGPYAAYIKDVEREQKHDASWLTRELKTPVRTVSLD